MKPSTRVSGAVSREGRVTPGKRSVTLLRYSCGLRRRIGAADDWNTVSRQALRGSLSPPPFPPFPPGRPPPLAPGSPMLPWQLQPANAALASTGMANQCVRLMALPSRSPVPRPLVRVPRFAARRPRVSPPNLTRARTRAATMGRVSRGEDARVRSRDDSHVAIRWVVGEPDGGSGRGHWRPTPALSESSVRRLRSRFPRRCNPPCARRTGSRRRVALRN